LTMEKRKWQWIPPTPANDKLTQSRYRSPLNNQEGSGQFFSTEPKDEDDDTPLNTGGN
jgi:hypothetical protein